MQTTARYAHLARDSVKVSVASVAESLRTDLAGEANIRPRGAGRGLALEQRVPLAQLHYPLGRHPEG